MSMHIDVDPSGHKVEITCPECGQKVIFTLNHAGSSVSCRGCGIDIEIVGENVDVLRQDTAAPNVDVLRQDTAAPKEIVRETSQRETSQ